MAEKLSINIDLRASRHVSQQSVGVHKDKEHTNYAKAPVEFSYRYDRMFAVTVLLIVIIIAFYFTVSAMLPEPGNSHSASKNSAVQQIIKEKNLLIAPQSTRQISSENNYRPIYLAYENIDVLEIFHSEPVIPETIATEPTSGTENSAQTSTDTLLEPDFEAVAEVKPVPEPEPTPAQIASTAETVSPEIVSPEKLKPASEPGAKIKHPEEHPVTPVKVQDDPFIQTFSDKLSRVLLVSNIYKKEPVNKLSYWVTGPRERAEKVYLFTQLDDSKGQMIEHQWWYQGKMLSNKQFTALGNRWRCYSSKNIGEFHQGKWMIKVLDQDGQLLSSVNFHYQIK